MAHFTPLISDLARGIDAAGDEIRSVTGTDAAAMAECDALACWGWRRAKRLRVMSKGKPVLVVERGYVGDRFQWTSLGWNGLNRRAVFPKPRMPGDARTAELCEILNMPPWQPKPDGYALILGQVQSDQACQNVNLGYQYRAWAQFLWQRGIEVKFRPHPMGRGQACPFPRAMFTRGTLAEDLAGAAFSISWNSNSSVDSVLAGVPSVTFDEGAMAWEVTSHSLQEPVTMPSRTEWAAQLAWCQWQPSELADGSAWKAVREVKP
jgi:hypothetical protein